MLIGGREHDRFKRNGHLKREGTPNLASEERQLSDRERTVLLLAAEGLTDKEIARHLNLSQRTIGTYWERLRLKLGPYSRTQLVARFLRVETDSDENGTSYRNLFATWEEGVWILSPEGRTIYANHRIATIFGIETADFVESDARTLFLAATSTNLDEVVKAAQEEPHVVEFQLQRQDGTSIWLRLRGSSVTDPRGRCSAIVLLVHDMTVQRRVKHTLESCESTLAFLSDHSSDLIARFDADLRCVSINPTLEQLLRQSSSDIVGHQLEELSGVFEPKERWIRCLQEALKTGQTKSFRSSVQGFAEELHTYLLPEPSPEFLPATIMSITTLNSPTNRRK